MNRDDRMFLVIFVLGCAIIGLLSYEIGFNHGTDSCQICMHGDV